MTGMQRDMVGGMDRPLFREMNWVRGPWTLEPSFCILWVPVSAGGCKVPLSGQASILPKVSSMAFEPSATNSGWGKGPIHANPCQFHSN